MKPIPRILLVDDRKEARATVLRLKHVLLVDVDLEAHPDYGLGALLGAKPYAAAIIGGTFSDSELPRQANTGPELVDLFRDLSARDTPNRDIPVCFLCGDPQELAAGASEEVQGMPYFQKANPGDWGRLVKWLEDAGLQRRTQNSEPAVRTGT